MTNPPDFDNRLRSYLTSAPIRDVDPGAAHIASRAQRRTKHRRLAGGALASVALLTSAGVVVNRLQTPGTVRTGAAKVRAVADTTTTETTVAPQPIVTAAAAFAASGAVPGGIDPATLKWPASNITWERVDSSLSISNIYFGVPGMGIHKEGDTFLAVSTEPGRAKPPTVNEPYFEKNALYTSKDGVSWQQRTVPDLTLGGATMADGTLYAVGTGTAAAQVVSPGTRGGVADMVVAVSKDGKTWKNQVLPLDLRGLVSKGAEVAMGPTQIAHSGTTVLVQSWVQVYLDPAKYLPRNVSVDQWGFEQRSDEFAVFGPPSAKVLACQAQQSQIQDGPTPTTLSPASPSPTSAAAQAVAPTAEPATSVPGALSSDCEAALSAPRPVAATYKFSDLGVDPAVVAEARNPTHVFASTNGGPFVSVQAPNAMSGQYNGTGFLTSVADGFLIGRTTYKIDGVGYQVSTTSVVHSADGNAWADFGSFRRAPSAETSPWLSTTTAAIASSSGSRAIAPE
jgi:hypothetical protein